MKKFWKSSYFALIMLFIYVPVIVMIVFSFNSGTSVSDFQGWSTKWYDAFVHNSPFVKSIITSLFVAVVSTAISLIIGVMAAIGLSKCKSVTQKAWVGIANIPLINADVVTAVSLMVVFMLSGIKFGIGTLLMAHVSFNVPYVLITVMPRLKKVDKSMLEAAQDLGAKPYQTLFKVILPVLRPAIITAAAIAFAMSFDDFIISYFTGGPETNVSTFIYTAKNIKPYVFAFGTCLVAVVVFGVVVWNIVSAINMKRKETKELIKDGYYKQEKINKLNEKLSKDYMKLNERKELVHSKNPILWLHYWYLKLLIKLYSIRNFDKKISKLEWKATKLKSEIRNEKRYYTRLKKVNKSIKAVQKDIAKEKNSPAKLKKLNNKLVSLNDKKDYLESEIEWIENRDERQERKAARIDKRIKQLNREFKKEFNSLSKKDIAWYRKKIKDLEEWKVEVEEGKNVYKLRMTTEKLRDLKEIRNNKIFELAQKEKAVEKKIFIWKDLGYKFEPRLNMWRGRNDYRYANALVSQDRYVSRFLNKIEWQIIKTENEIQATNEVVNVKREKYFPSDDQPSKPRNWLQRSWKWLSVLLVAAGAFSGLTVAYVKNNTYDFTVGNWGEYIDTTLITKFQKETGLKVNYQVYDSNETLYNKLYTFDYDVMVPSDYMVQRIAEQNKIQALDWSKLKINMPDKDGNPIKPVEGNQNINPELAKLMYGSKVNVDAENKPENATGTILDYAVPYFWGDISIVFNTTKSSVSNFLAEQLNTKENVSGINLNDPKKKLVGNNANDLGWDIVEKAKAKGLSLALPNDPKNLFMIADEVKYQSINFGKDKDGKDLSLNESKKRIDEAGNYIKDLISGNKVKLQGDDMYDEVQAGNFDVAVMYSGDIKRITEDMGEEPYSYVRPFTKDGQKTNVYSDNMTIGKKTSGKKLEYAYKFINFMFEEENAEKNSDYVGLASPNDSAITKIADGLDEYKKDLYEPIIAQKGNTYDANDKVLSFQNNEEVDKYTVDKYNSVVSHKN